MKKRLMAFVLIIAILCPLLSSCSRENDSKFFLYIENEPQSLDPQSVSDTEGKLIIRNSFQGLYEYDENGSAVLGAAVAHSQNPDGLTHFFTLRDDIKWSNGDKVTSADFVFAFRRLFDSRTGSEQRGEYYFIKNGQKIINGELGFESIGVRALDEKTLVIELDEYNIRFKELLCEAGAMPCNQKFFEETKGRYGLEANKTLYNGALFVKSWIHGDSLALRRNPYTPKDNAPESLSIFIKSDTASYETAFINERIDFLEATALTAHSLLNEKYTYQSEKVRSWAIVFNTNSQVFKNENIRKGLSLAFDRRAYSDKLWFGHESSAMFIPSSVRGEAEASSTRFNEELAKEYFKRGLEELKLTRLPEAHIILPKTSVMEDALNYAGQVWQQHLGAYLGIMKLEKNEYEALLESGSFDAALVPIVPDDKSMYSYLSHFKTGNSKNVSEFSDSQFDELLLSALKDKNKESSNQKLIAAENILYEKAVIIPVCIESKYFFTGKGIKGLKYSFYSGIVDVTSAQK